MRNTKKYKKKRQESVSRKKKTNTRSTYKDTSEESMELLCQERV
jgi:hypothetical protein